MAVFAMLSIKNLEIPFEDYKPSIPVCMYVVSWNVNGKSPPEDLAPIIDPEIRPGIVIVGLQGVAVYPHQVVINKMFKDPWTKKLDDTLLVKGYYKLKHVTMVGIVLNIYLLNEHAGLASVIDYRLIRADLKGLSGSKGAVYLRMKFDTITLALTTGHFKSKNGGQVRRIDRGHTPKGRRTEDREDDYTLWLGDFHFHPKVCKDNLRCPMIRHMIYCDDINTKPNFDSEEKVNVEEPWRPIVFDRVLYTSAIGAKLFPVDYYTIPYIDYGEFPVIAVYQI